MASEKKGKKGKNAPAEEVDIKPNNDIEFLPEMFVAEMQRRQNEVNQEEPTMKLSTVQTNLMSVTEFLSQLHQANDIEKNYFKVWTHDVIASWWVSMTNAENASLFSVQDQPSLLSIFYLLCEYAKVNADQQEPVRNLDSFFDWIRTNTAKLSPVTVGNPWDYLLGLLKKEEQLALETGGVLSKEERSSLKSPLVSSIRTSSRRSRISSLRSQSESKIIFNKQLDFFEDIFRQTFRFPMQFEMLRQMAIGNPREWREIESYDHRILAPRTYWAKDARKAAKKPSKNEVVASEEPDQSQFILPLSMAEGLEEFFRILVEGPDKDKAEEEQGEMYY